MDKYCSKYLLKKSNSNTSNLNSLNDSFPIAFNNFDINNSIHSSKYSDSKLNNKFLPGDSPQQTILQPFLQNNNSENRINLINAKSEFPNDSLLNFDDLMSFLNFPNKKKINIKAKKKKNSTKIKFYCEQCNKNYKRKEYLTKHLFFKHSGYNGIICPYCAKNIKYFHEHVKFCKLKYKFNFQNYERAHESYRETYFDELKTFKALKNSKDLPQFNHSDIIISTNNKNCLNFESFKYYEDCLIDNGGNMKVYYGKINLSNEDIAVKIDLRDKKKPDIITEIEMLTRLKGIPQIPSFYFYEFVKGKNIMAESLYGPSLKRFYKFDKNIFEPILVSIIGVQIMEILGNIHKRGIIHNDLKPHNICWGKFKNSCFKETENFFLIDFGYSRKIFEPSDNNDKKVKISNIFHYHYSNKHENKLSGTPDFMAISISEGLMPNRATDIEELIYTLIYLLKKGLPWENVKSKNHIEKCKKTCEMKKNFDLNELFHGIPDELLYIYKNALKLNFDEEPDYNLFSILLNNILIRFGVSNKEKQKKFLQGKIDQLITSANIEYNQDLQSKIKTELFSGYPINWSKLS